MIHILLGGDTKNKNIYIKELARESDSVFIPAGVEDKSLVIGYSSNISLFGETPVVIMDNLLSEGAIIFSPEELKSINESDTVFIFKEDKLSVSEQKKYKKYAEIRSFELKKEVTQPKFNVFGITDAFANRDKINSWALYREGIESGVEPEAIAGILFWKIKTMILNGSRFFNKEELKNQSSKIVSIYHSAHRGEVDFVISLEQFILTSLSSK